MATAKKAAKAPTEPKLIASFEEACEKLGLAPKLPVVDALGAKHAAAIVAHYKLIIIAQALNEGWEPNWDDDDEYKYYPWFDMEKRTTAGSGFAFSGVDYGRTCSVVGSRLAFKSSALAEHAGKAFLDLYKEYFLIAPAG